MQAVIMAGGVGNRLRPLTCRIPKPMVPLMDRPVMEYAVGHLKKHGILDVAVTLQYLPEVITDYFKDGSQFGMNIRYFYEDKPLGTAGSVRQAAADFKDTFVVLSGDGLTDIDISSAMRFHSEKGAMATLVLKRMDSPLEFGTVMLNADGSIDRFVEKPTRAQVFSDTVNTGIYILEPEVLEYVEKDIMVDFANDVFPRLLQDNKPLFGFVSENYWCDIGSAETYLAAHRDILNGTCRVHTGRTGTQDGIFIGEEAMVHPDAKLEAPCYIGTGCIIEEGAKIGAYSVIGAGSAVCAGADIKRSVLWPNARVGPRAQVRGATLCDGSVLLEDAKVCEGAVVGSETIVGKNTTVSPHVMIWPGKRICDDANIRKNIVWQPQPPAGALSEGGMRGVWGVDMYPEAVLDMVHAMERAFGPVRRVLLSHEGGSHASLVCDALSLGWRSLGATVVLAGIAPLLLVREAILQGEAQWGMVVRAVGDEISIRIVDKNGTCLGRKAFRKVAQNANNAVSTPALHPGLCEIATLSMDGVIKRLQSTMGPASYDSVFVIGGNGAGADALIHALKAVGAHIDTMQDPAEIQELVENGLYTAGFWIDDQNDTLSMVTKNGILNEVQMLDIAIYALARNTSLKKMPLFLECSHNLEEWLKSQGIGTVRVGREEGDVWAVLSGQEQAQSAMLVMTEPVCVALLCAQMCMAEPEWMQSPVLRTGDVCTVTREIDCAHEKLGMLIKELSAGINAQDRLLVEGVRVRHKDGFALVQPHASRARCRIVCRANNEEFATELAALYENKVRNILNKDTGDTQDPNTVVNSGSIQYNIRK
ncbi:MAG: sugar phosphate nucleotidyltransferase [Bacillota bacterium]